ncbi:PRC-barrel domain-containing protein [Methylocapsa sp. S129]|uniref:PRC-barrel domain-containing protein n=1 Tax=Methylocapsa sp. S129 TaxID=1641869 RepID=UPI001FEF63C0|nr:PRC-barrel domain-containing protein [Methylocapsa sp. S129]
MLKQLGYIGLIGGALVAFPALAQTAGDSFVKEQAINQWRASKLVGVSVMGADQKKIGKIADVLFDHDGNAQVIVIGVGGFLGMGAKEVGVPFKTMQWRTEGRTVATAGPPATASGGGAPATAAKTDPAATEANQGYPDMGVLNMTKAQLQSAPDFHYAPSPEADAGASAAPPPVSTTPMTQKPAGATPAPQN